jgi:hypothetical protein
MSFLRRLLALTMLAALSLASSSALAGDDSNLAEARRLYNEAKKAMTAKRYKDAAAAFEGASNIKAHAVALYTAAQAWELAGEQARAADAYARALSTPQLSDSQAKRSGERLAELQKMLGVVVVSGKEGTRVRLDDHSEFEVPAKLHGTTGSHELSITRADGSTDKKQVELSTGSTAEVDAEEQPAPEEKTAEQPKEVKLSEPAKHPVEVETTEEGPWKTIGYVTVGAGVAALAGGALLGLSASDAEDTYKTSPTRATYDHAKGLESKTNIMFIAGGVLTAGGVGLLIWGGPKKSKEKAVDAALEIEVGPSQLVAKGRF